MLNAIIDWSLRNRLVVVVGWLVIVVSTLEIDPLGLAGLRQSFDYARRAASSIPPFQVVGLHRLVRHPTYLGWLVVFWATPSMSAGHALLATLMSAYILVAIRFEERDLVRVHGPDYERYQSEISMLVPWRGRVYGRVPPRQ